MNDNVSIFRDTDDLNVCELFEERIKSFQWQQYAFKINGLQH